MTPVLIRWVDEEWFYVGTIDGAVIWGERVNAAVIQTGETDAAMALIASIYGDETDLVAEPL